VPASDPVLVRGVRWTEKHKGPFSTASAYGTYSASLLALALTRIGPARHRKRIHALADRLVDAQGPSRMWGYRLTSGGGDNSNSQFAILALWAAKTLAGHEAPLSTWQRIHKLYVTTQAKDGGWHYTGGLNGSTGSMTAAGLVGYIYASAALKRNTRAARRSEVAQRALKPLLKRKHLFSNLYYAYALERAGTVAAIELEKWYVPGARALVGMQQENGSFKQGHDRTETYGTSLALLFLSRATLTPDRPAAKTKRESFPDLSDPGQLERGFGFYLDSGKKGRKRILPEFRKAGPGAIGLFVGKLRDKREGVRVIAFELLTSLLQKRLFFDPRATLEEREVMIVPIESFWKRHGASLRWDARKQRFVLPS